MATKSRQQTLIPDKADLVWELIEKVRSSGLLDAAEMRTLEEAIAPPARPRGYQDVVNAWFAEYEKAIGAECPRPTDPEFRALNNIFKRRLNGRVDKMLQLIKGWWRWRASVKWEPGCDPQPTPFGLQKNLSRVIEFLAKEKLARDAAQHALEQMREFEQRAREQRAPRRQTVERPENAPSCEEVRGFAAQLAQMKSLT